MARISPASPLRYPVSGWVEAGLFVLAIALLTIAYVVGNRVGAHPIALVLYAMTVSAVALLAVTGVGRDALSIVLAPQTWLVGIGTIGLELFYFLLLVHVSPALGSLLLRIAIPLSLAAGWTLFARRPGRLSLLGAGVVLLGIVLPMLMIDDDNRLPAAAAGFACAVASTLRSFATEFHPWNRNAQTVMEKLRVTGLVVLVPRSRHLRSRAWLRCWSA